MNALTMITMVSLSGFFFLFGYLVGIYSEGKRSMASGFINLIRDTKYKAITPRDL